MSDLVTRHEQLFTMQTIAKGKKYKVALVAAMRKLITTLNVMVKTKTLWNQHAIPAEVKAEKQP